MAKMLLKGNEAVVKGALLAGCRAYYGYPITPASEIAETAAVSLGILANDANTDLLIAMLEDDTLGLRNDHKIEIREKLPTRTRAFAAYGLGLIGYATPSEEVRAKINNACMRLLDGEGKTMGTRDIQVGCLTAMGLTPLQAGAATPVEEGQTTSAALRTRGDQVAWLMKYYLDETNNFMIRAHAPTAMARLLQGYEDAGLKKTVADQLTADLSKHAKKQDEIQASVAVQVGHGDVSDRLPRGQGLHSREASRPQPTQQDAALVGRNERVERRPGKELRE